MLNVNLVNMNVLAFLRDQGNIAEGYCTDQCGRFILPLNWVTYGQPTDEGPHILLNGIVRQICGDELVIDPFGFFDLTWQTRLASSCVKHPSGTLLHELLLYFTAANLSILQHYPGLHLNGRPICFTS